MKRQSRRYLGIELAGAKNQKTAVAILEYYPKEKKTFLLDIHDRITAIPKEDDGKPSSSASSGVYLQTGDEALLELIAELAGGEGGVERTGVNTALDLPPCFGATPQAGAAAIQWMREITRKAARAKLKTLEFTAYTQRPIELWVRYQVLPKLEPYERFEIDETLGGNRAPLTARMHYLKPLMKSLNLTEVWPKLSVATLAAPLALSRRTVQVYRQLEQGMHAREEILEAMIEREDIFIYERDIRKLSHNLSAFDAFFCAHTALLADVGRTVPRPAGFPQRGGWVHYPAGTPKK